MARKRSTIETGSGDVFTDLGYADARDRRLKVELAVEVNRQLKARKLTQTRAAALLGLRQPHISDLSRYRLDRFSAARLMEFLTRLGSDVEIRIQPRPARRASAAVRVLHLG
jgi:predicted XRE-type DNA-binding protein